MINRRIAILFLFIMCQSIDAFADRCFERTIFFFANGMKNSPSQADTARAQLQKLIKEHLPSECDTPKVVLAYNVNEKLLHTPVPEWLEVFSQFKSNLSSDDPDLQHHLSMYRDALKGRHQVIVVAHSQGNFYANAAYDILANEVGTGLNDIFRIMSVATPDARVGDDFRQFLARYVTLNKDPIKDVPFALDSYETAPCASTVAWACHDFVSSYLTYPNPLRDILLYIDGAKKTPSSHEPIVVRHGLSVDLFNTDDVLTITLNGKEVCRGVFGRVEICSDLYQQLSPGDNILGIRLENTGAGWTYGFRIRADDVPVIDESCGIAGVSGCIGDDKQLGATFDDEFTIVKQVVPPPTNQPPTAGFSMSVPSQVVVSPGPLNVVADPISGEARVTFTDASTDPDGTSDIVSRVWTVNTQAEPLSIGDLTFGWGFTPGGPYTVKLTITDSAHHTSEAFGTINVAPAQAITTALTGGVYVHQQQGLIGTTFLYDPNVTAGLINQFDITGPPGWNNSNPLRIFRYQPPGTATSRSIRWEFVQPTTGTYTASTSVGGQQVQGTAFIDTTRQLAPPTITAVTLGISGTVTVNWTAPSEARSFLVRINPSPYLGVITRDLVVSGATRSVTMTGLPLSLGATYQADVFAFSQDVITPDPLDGPFNIGADDRLFVAQPTALPTLTNLPNTGAVSEGGIDPNYVLVSGPSCPSGNCPVFATVADGFPIGPYWTLNDATSKWIEPLSGVADTHGAGQYIYRLSFGLSAAEAASAVVGGRWATDDTGVDIRVNGVSTGLQTSSSFLFSSFQISNGFRSGLNTLDFVVVNHDCGSCPANPVGLRVEFNTTTLVSAPPWDLAVISGPPDTVFDRCDASSFSASGDPDSGTTAISLNFDFSNHCGDPAFISFARVFYDRLASVSVMSGTRVIASLRYVVSAATGRSDMGSSDHEFVISFDLTNQSAAELPHISFEADGTLVGSQPTITDVCTSEVGQTCQPLGPLALGSHEVSFGGTAQCNGAPEPCALANLRTFAFLFTRSADRSARGTQYLELRIEELKIRSE